MHALGIERLCVFGMPPVEFVRLAADLGCDGVGIGLAPSPGYNPHNYPDWSLRDDAGLRREMVSALHDRGVAISIVEGFAFAPNHDVRAYDRDLDIVCELGGDRINVVSLDKDLERTIEGFAVLAGMAAQRGLQVSAEMGSLGPIAQVEPALALARGVGAANFSLLIDAMHFFRLGNTIEQLAAVAPELIGYVQLCDAPWAARFDTYLEEALYERMPPGAGELPLREFVRRLPRDVPISLEIPMRSLADQGVGPRERLAPCVDAAQTLLSAVAGTDAPASPGK
ncbi:TIM barrel protein [Phenylobacterium sp. LjRoot219]|uniref:sugar phosphate isomerase/epimerase family protein n=1 Tax=Phenylobacterium sp. LjRoot219 TaxID=3342283 RepID=UPI003ECC835A